MNRAVILIPLTKSYIFFNYAYMNRFAACIPRHIKSVMQQFFPIPVCQYAGNNARLFSSHASLFCISKE